MDNLTENSQVTADTAEAEVKEAAPGLGKFKDVKTLLKAYSDLEAEFTRRSQRLKELEKENKSATFPDGEARPTSRADGASAPPILADGTTVPTSRADGASAPPILADGASVPTSRADGTTVPTYRESDDERIARALADEMIRDAVIGDYLKGLQEKSVPLTSGGGAVTAPRNTPKTIKEAGSFARQFLKG